MRATLRSMSRSHRSFTTQPAERITTAPTANSTTSRIASTTLGRPSRIPHSPGRNSSQAPIGRSSRASSAYGRQPIGSRATQPSAMMSVWVAMAATLPAAMSGSIRLFVTAPLAAGAAVAATEAQAHYLGTVMRRAVGDAVVLFNGRDGEWAARLLTLRRGAASFVVERMLRPQAAEPDVWLVFALLKRDATDLVVQKATELGVAALRPVFTDADQRPAGQPGAAARDCHRGGRTERAPDRAGSSRPATVCPRCCTPGPPGAACSLRPSAPRHRHSPRPANRPRC